MALTLEISGFGESIEDLEETRKILNASYKKLSKAKKSNSSVRPKKKLKKGRSVDDEAKDANNMNGVSNSAADINIDTLVNQTLGDSLANSTKKAELDQLLENLLSNSASFLDSGQQTAVENNIQDENTEANSLGFQNFDDGINHNFPHSSTFYNDANFDYNNESTRNDGIDMQSFLESYSRIESRRDEEKRKKKYHEDSAISRKILQRVYDIIHEKWSCSRRK